MSKAPRENRVPIMMSEDELAMVDDWRFQNRVATRSDAIRRLCHASLILDRESPDIRGAIDKLREAVVASDDAFAAVADGLSQDQAAQLAAALIKVGRVASELEEAALNVFVPLELLRKIPKTDAAMIEADGAVLHLKASAAIINQSKKG